MQEPLREPRNTPPNELPPPHINNESSNLSSRGPEEIGLPQGATATFDQRNKGRSLQAQEKVPRYHSRRGRDGNAQHLRTGGPPAGHSHHLNNSATLSPRGGRRPEHVPPQRQPDRATFANGSSPTSRPSDATPDRAAGQLASDPILDDRIGPFARGARESTRTSTSMQGNANLGRDASERIAQPAHFLNQMADSYGPAPPA